MNRLSRRKVFAGGMLAFVLALFVLSTFVWDVQVKTDASISEDQVLGAARKEGIYPFQWAFRLQDSATLAQRLTRDLPGAAWVGVEKIGTRIVITVVESKMPEAAKLQNPRDLVAKSDAVVTKIIAENGRPKVQRNDRVRKGDVLISGTIGVEGHSKTVVSKGEVRGLVWHEYEIVSPLTRKIKTFTGAVKDRGYFVIGNRALQISGYGGDSFDKSEIRSEVQKFNWWGWTLPFGKMKERELEVSYHEDQLTPVEAKDAGLAGAREQLLDASGPGATIKAEKLLHEQTENGKVIINVLFEVEQSIAVERPIIQTPNAQGE